MIQTSVESSNLAKVGWQDETLVVQFKRGHMYRYSGVPLQVYNDLVDAESVGGYFSKNIAREYPYATLEAAEASALGFS